MGIEPMFPDRKSGVLTNYTNGAFRSKAIVLLASTLTFMEVGILTMVSSKAAVALCHLPHQKMG